MTRCKPSRGGWPMPSPTSARLPGAAAAVTPEVGGRRRRRLSLGRCVPMQMCSKWYLMWDVIGCSPTTLVSLFRCKTRDVLKHGVHVGRLTAAPTLLGRVTHAFCRSGPCREFDALRSPCSYARKFHAGIKRNLDRLLSGRLATGPDM